MNNIVNALFGLGLLFIFVDLICIFPVEFSRNPIWMKILGISFIGTVVTAVSFLVLVLINITLG